MSPTSANGPAAPSTHHFKRGALLADGARAAAGLLISFGPLVLLETAVVVTWICSGLTILFAWFAGRTAVRARSRVVLSAKGIELLGPRPSAIRWEDLEEIRLAYFAPRRAQERTGWMQLTLRERTGSRLRVDSTLERFDDLLATVHRVASAADLPFDPATSSNFAALGLARADRPDVPPPVRVDRASPG